MTQSFFFSAIMSAFQALFQLAQSNTRCEKLPDEELKSLDVGPLTIRLQGGAKDVPYNQALRNIQTPCVWKHLVHTEAEARVVFGVTIGAGMGGPSSEPIETYLYGVYHAWPLDRERSKGEYTEQLLLTLFYGVAALARFGVIPDRTSLTTILKKVRSHGRVFALWKYVVSKTRPQDRMPVDASWEMDHIEPGQHQRFLNINTDIINGARYGDYELNTRTHKLIPVSGSPTDPGSIVDVLLTTAWILMGSDIDLYRTGILCGVFPVLPSGSNIKLERFSRLVQRIAGELTMPITLSVSMNGLIHAWDGMSRLLSKPGWARSASIRGMRIGQLIGSKWAEVLSERMPYHGLSAIVLIATAVRRFPNAGWTNFFDTEQIDYDPRTLHLMTDRLMEYAGFLENVRSAATLPFSAVDYATATDEQKINYLIIAFRAIRPTKTYPDWMHQGEITCTIMAQARQNPYMMYENIEGRSREIADVAYYAFLLLRDIAKQASLQHFNNNYASGAIRPQEVERLVADFGRILTSLPGSSGIMEFATKDLLTAVHFITEPFVDDHNPTQVINETLDAAIEILTEHSRPPLVPGPSTQPQPTPPRKRRKTRAATVRAASHLSRIQESAHESQSDDGAGSDADTGS